jgi:hypothetical protein
MRMLMAEVSHNCGVDSAVYTVVLWHMNTVKNWHEQTPGKLYHCRLNR